MSHAIPGHSTVSASFEVPLEMLAACHGRIRHQCEVLSRLALHLQSNGADAEARDAAAAIVRYFDVAAKLHHDDEEVDLFPALLEAMAGSDAVCISEMASRVASDHRAVESMSERVMTALRCVIQGNLGGAARMLSPDEVASFVGAYESHIAFEEAEVLPMAARLLSDEQIDKLGRAMRARRGIALPEDE